MEIVRINEEFFQIFNKIASFDLDHTIIRPKNGRKLYKDISDYEFIPGMIELIKEYSKDHNIVIFTNSSMKDNFEEFVREVFSDSLFDCSFLILRGIDARYRKPSILMWKEMEKILGKRCESGFFMGDAVNDKTFSDCDYLFYLNVKKYLKLTEDSFEFKLPIYFEKIELTSPKHYFEDLLVNVEEKRLNNKKLIEEIVNYEGKQMVVLVGPPASGKSTLSKILNEKNKKLIIINQDFLKTNKKVMSEIDKNLKKGLSVIIDRQNYKTRDELREKAKDIRLITVFIDIPRRVAEHMNVHRAIENDIEPISSICYNMYYSSKGLVRPGGEENVREYYFIPEGLEWFYWVGG